MGSGVEWRGTQESESHMDMMEPLMPDVSYSLCLLQSTLQYTSSSLADSLGGAWCRVSYPLYQ